MTNLPMLLTASLLQLRPHMGINGMYWTYIFWKSKSCRRSVKDQPLVTTCNIRYGGKKLSIVNFRSNSHSLCFLSCWIQKSRLKWSTTNNNYPTLCLKLRNITVQSKKKNSKHDDSYIISYVFRPHKNNGELKKFK